MSLNFQFSSLVSHFGQHPALLRTTNPIRTQHPGSSEQILEVISAIQDFFFKAKQKILVYFLFIFFLCIFFFCKKKEDFSLTHTEASFFLKPTKVASTVQDFKPLPQLKKKGVGKGR